jgi:hypothetical protein
VAYKTRVQLTVLNSAGEVIGKLVDEEKKPGTYEIDFAACVGPFGEKRYLAGGTYYYRIQAGDFVQTRKLVILE